MTSGHRHRRPSVRGYVAISALAAVLAAGSIAAYARAGGQYDEDPKHTRTLYGMAVHRDHGESEPDAVKRNDDVMGRQGLVRVFYPGAPDPWPGEVPGRSQVVSFKLPPQQVVDGDYDQMMRTWFATAPRDLTVYWVLYHEPEDDIQDGLFTPEQYRAAYTHLDKLADEAHNKRLKTTVILQSWSTVEASHRNWHDFVPPEKSFDVLAWDVYNRGGRNGRYTSPTALLDEPRRASESVGKPFGIAEMGSILVPGDNGTRRAAWLRDMSAYLEQFDSLFVCYFNLPWNDGKSDFQLNDDASQRAWRAISG